MFDSMPKISATLVTVIAVCGLTALIAFLAACTSGSAAAADKELKVLMVGNSFAWCCRQYPQTRQLGNSARSRRTRYTIAPYNLRKARK